MLLRGKRRGDGLDVNIDFWIDVLKMMLGMILGSVVTMVITGLMAKHFIVDKVMSHPKVKRLQKSIDKGIDKLEELLETKNKTMPEAADYETKTG